MTASTHFHLATTTACRCSPPGCLWPPPTIIQRHRPVPATADLPTPTTVASAQVTSCVCQCCFRHMSASFSLAQRNPIRGLTLAQSTRQRLNDFLGVLGSSHLWFFETRWQRGPRTAISSCLFSAHVTRGGRQMNYSTFWFRGDRSTWYRIIRPSTHVLSHSCVCGDQGVRRQWFQS